MTVRLFDDSKRVILFINVCMFLFCTAMYWQPVRVQLAFCSKTAVNRQDPPMTLNDKLYKIDGFTS